MASGSLGTLTLDLVAKIGGFTGPLDEAGRASKKYAASVKKASEDAGKAAASLGKAIGAGAAAAAVGLTVLVAKQLEVIGDQDDLSKRLRTTVESLGILQRAGELSGISLDQISGAATKLELAMGKAASGSKKQVEAFDRLGISYKELAELPLDERISTINQALEDNVPAYERAAVAATLFGAKNAAALQQLDPETLAEANRQITVFGVKLSDIDSSKVEAAGDAISIFGLAMDGVAKQITVELSPLLTQLSKDFLDSAEAAGGIGTKVKDAASSAVTGIGFILNAADGVKRAFDIIAQNIVATFAVGVGSANQLAAALTRALDKIPGVDLTKRASDLQATAAANFETAGQALDKMREDLEKPLVGDAFKDYYANAQKAAEDAAKAGAEENKVKKTGQKTGEEYTKGLNDQALAEKAAAAEAKKLAAERERQIQAINDQIQGFELEVATLGMTASQQKLYKLEVDGATEAQLKQAAAALQTVDAFEAQKKAQDEALDTQEYLRALNDTVEASRRAVDIEVEAIGVGDKRADQMREINAIQDEYAQKIEDLAAAQGTANKLSEEGYAARIAALQDAMNQEVAIVQDGAKRKEDAEADGWNGANKALEDYMDEAKNLSSQVGDLTQNALGETEDAFVQFAQTGKLSFKGLADSIIADLFRIGAKQLTSNIAGGLMGAASGGGGSTGGGAGYLSLLSSFAGLFDVGGFIPSGQFGIVGERGPELVSGPATVTSRTATAGMMGGQTIVNNMDLSGMKNAREARDAAATVGRAIAGTVQGSGRYT